MTETLAHWYSSDSTHGFQKYLSPFAFGQSSISIGRFTVRKSTVSFYPQDSQLKKYGRWGGTSNIYDKV